jgi:putative ABC transport system permease protein
MLADLKFALRQLRKSPGFAITAVLTLAIGIGVNTGVFSMMDAVVLRPLAVPDLNRVVTIDEAHGNGNYKPVALPNYLDWRRQNHSFEDLAIRTEAEMNLTGAGDAAHVQATYISSGFFPVMRATPLLGRVFAESDCQPGRDAEAVLSYGLWQKQFGGEASVLGRHIELDGRAYTVIGVMPKTVQYPSTTNLFLPFAPTAQQIGNRGDHDYLVIGRLRPGVTAKQAQMEMAAIAARLAKTYPATNQGWSVHVESLLAGINGDLTPLFYMLVQGATLFVLLVVCANLANLGFARGIARRPEIAMRTALGARRSRILRQVLLENILLGLMGAAGGLLIAKLDLHLSMATMPGQVARYMSGWANITLNGRALAFSLLLAVGAGVVSGLMPAMEALRVNLVEQLKAGSRSLTGSRRTHRLRNIFAAAQIALAVALVVGAALMSKGIWSLLQFANVHQPKQVLMFTAYLPEARYGTQQRANDWYTASLDRLRALPGVTHAEVATALPYGTDGWMDDFRIENRPLVPGKFQSAERVTVSAGYFDALRIPLVEGRPFNAGDGLNTQPVAIVSRNFAERYFPGENPLGHRIRMGSGSDTQEPWVKIVGIVGDTSYDWTQRGSQPAMYVNAAQLPPIDGTSYIVVTQGDPLALAAAAKKTLAAVDPAIALDGVETYATMLHNSVLGLIYAAANLGVDAGIALLLAAIGIFGVMSNLVAERIREIGVRLALGAQRQDVLRMILRRAAWLTGIGVAVGLVLAAGLARLIANLLFGVRPGDPLVFATTTITLAVIALVASWLPARTAAGTDPMQALRDQ